MALSRFASPYTGRREIRALDLLVFVRRPVKDHEGSFSVTREPWGGEIVPPAFGGPATEPLSVWLSNKGHNAFS